MARLSAETAALIADTELSITKELRNYSTTLIIDRPLDADGKPIARRFICSAEINGRTYTSTAGTQPAAESSLRRQFNRLGFEPTWTAIQDNSSLAPDVEPEESVLEIMRTIRSEIISAIHSELQTPISQPEIPDDEPEEDDEPGEHEDPAHGLTVYVPNVDNGYVTPLSDAQAWCRMYIEAWKMTTGFSPYSFRSLDPQECADIRAAVSAAMLSGDAGDRAGIAAKAVAPWQQGVNAEGRQMNWVRVIPKTPDPTTKPFRQGAGTAREAWLTNLSGLPVNPDRQAEAREWRERRASRSWAGFRNKTTVAQREDADERRAKAHAAGSAARTAAFESGHGDEAETHYKWVYCAVLRNFGDRHAEYERQLADLGVTAEDIESTAAEMKAA